MNPPDRQSEEAVFRPGTHWLAEFTGVPVDALTDAKRVLRGFGESLEQAGFTILGKQSHRFDGGGFTGLFLLSESHASIHTWPERSYAAVDLFTCGERDARPVFDALRRLLEPDGLELKAHRREPGAGARPLGLERTDSHP